MNTIRTLLLIALAASTFNAAIASDRISNNGQYEITDLGQTRELVEGLASPAVAPELARLMHNANRIVRVTLKQDRMIADVIRNIYVIQAQVCRPVVVPNPCFGGGILEMTAVTGTFLPMGQAAVTQYQARVIFGK